jgi:hypothetical protein
MTPSGTPTPAPIAVSRLEFDPPLVGLDVDVGVDVDEPGDEVAVVDEAADSPATPGRAVPCGTSTDLKLPQLTVPFSQFAVPQQ